jgi:hypothetical protein
MDSQPRIGGGRATKLFPRASPWRASRASRSNPTATNQAATRPTVHASSTPASMNNAPPATTTGNQRQAKKRRPSIWSVPPARHVNAASIQVRAACFSAQRTDGGPDRAVCTMSISARDRRATERTSVDRAATRSARVQVARTQKPSRRGGGAAAEGTERSTRSRRRRATTARSASTCPVAW